MGRWVGVALVFIVCVGYTFVSARKVKKNDDIDKELQKYIKEYEAKRTDILESGGNHQEVRAALIKLDNIFSQKKRGLREKFNQRTKKKKVRAKDGYTRKDERRYGQKEIERKKQDILKRKH